MDTYFEKVMDSYLAEKYPDVRVLERSVLEDHIQALLEILSKYAVPKVVGDIKANTARILRKEFEYLRRDRKCGRWGISYPPWGQTRGS